MPTSNHSKQVLIGNLRTFATHDILIHKDLEYRYQRIQQKAVTLDGIKTNRCRGWIILHWLPDCFIGNLPKQITWKRAMEQLGERMWCASWKIPTKSSDQWMTLLDCQPATGCTTSSGEARKEELTIIIGNYSSKDFVCTNKGTHVACCHWLRTRSRGGDMIRTAC